jgi:lipid A ethanolaminephosphotransferase
MPDPSLANTLTTARALPRPVVSAWLGNMAVATLLTLAFNLSFMHSIWPLGSWALAVPLMSLLFLINIVICQLFAVGKLRKFWLISLLVAGAGSQYFMQQYGILIDKGMLQNALETDSHEIAGLINLQMLPYFIVYALLPACIVCYIKVRPQTVKSGVVTYLTVLFSAIILIAIIVISQYQGLAAVFREHRYLKHQAVPLNVLNAAAGFLQSRASDNITPMFSHYAQDAHFTPSVDKPLLVIMVLGETVRADHLGINSYGRNTTPKLAKRNLINLGAIDACGTATAVSVPCMFSYLNQASYNDSLAKNSDNVLDIMQRAGAKVLWRDNNSGCKGMCDRVELDQSFTATLSNKCVAGECTDNALLNRLKDKILAEKSAMTPIFVVLHQQGNHGPEYYKRSLPEQKQFLPECTSNLLHQCQQQQIVNAYDNAILATDDMLDATIALLEELSAEFDTAMLYVADHGESLGENGVYLHGLPLWMAPEAQTKVPMIMWFSQQITQHNALDTDCIKHNALAMASHDMLFDSILSLMQMTSIAIRPEQDMFSNCVNLANNVKVAVPAS